MKIYICTGSRNSCPISLTPWGQGRLCRHLPFRRVSISYLENIWTITKGLRNTFCQWVALFHCIRYINHMGLIMHDQSLEPQVHINLLFPSPGQLNHLQKYLMCTLKYRFPYYSSSRFSCDHSGMGPER